MGATIQHHLKKHKKQESEIVEHLKKSLYVDDFVSGAENDEKAIEIYKGSKQLMSIGGFNLRKWSSNYDDLTKSIDTFESRYTDRLTDRSTVGTPDVSSTSPLDWRRK